MNDFERLMHDVLQKKMEDGSFDAIVDKYVSDAIEKSLSRLFSKPYNGEPGEGYVYIEKAINPLVMHALEQSRFNETAEKTKLAINNLVEQCVIAQTGKALNASLGIFNKNEKINFRQEYSLKKIFDKYKEYVKSNIDKDFCDDHDIYIEEGTAYISVCCSVEDVETERYSYDDRKSVTFYIENVEEDDLKVSFFLKKDYKGRWLVDEGHGPLGLDALCRLSDMQMFLYALANEWAAITDINEYDDEVCVDNLYE